ncbi:MAG: MxaS protein [Methylobacter sp.]|nr:MxaS protein [Candidatus Methylobacter titanis]
MTETLTYRLPWQSSSVYPGAHPGQMIGAGQLFKRHEPLIASPDPRRIDLRASVLDPFSGYRVRVYQQQSSVNVYLLADMSASMAYADKQQTLIRFLLTAANSAFGYGDKFGFIGCTERIEHRWLLPACQNLGRVSALAKQLEGLTFTGSAKGLQNAVAYLPAERSLVFLLSDCHFPLPQLRALLGSLQAHDVIPLVLWNQDEYAALPNWGLIAFQDMENHATRTLFMRPALRQKIIAVYRQRQHDLKHLFRAFGSEPLFITERYSTQTINRYLQQRVA